MNLVSHDCHSYLHITLTNGILPRKAMVMAGENAANDADEEVYGNDGAERHELLNEDGKLIDTGQIIITQKLQVLKNDINMTMVSWRKRVTSVDRYITFVSTITVTAVT